MSGLVCSNRQHFALENLFKKVFPGDPLRIVIVAHSTGEKG
jgi:hypothetical protein